MNKLIYLSFQTLEYLDPVVADASYKHNRWFNLLKSRSRAVHVNSRNTKLDTPWPLAPTVSPLPEITQNELRFDVVMESIADEFCQEAERSGKTIYFFWSGGIDSTSILVSLLKVASHDLLKNLVIVIDREKTLAENAYFYYRYVHDRITVQELMDFKVTADNYDKILVVDGEGGNQCIQGPSVQRLVYREQQHLLNEPWRSHSDIKKLLSGCSDFYYELITESIQHAPISIDTGYDFLWWAGFNFKFDDVLVRKMFSYSQYLTAEQTKYFWENSLHRFYQHPLMQIWSMNTRDLRRHYTVTTTVKYFPKKYIYDFDQNDFYYSSKTEQGSDTKRFSRSTGYSAQSLYFSFDSDWNKYSLASVADRQWISKLLEIY